MRETTGNVPTEDGADIEEGEPMPETGTPITMGADTEATYRAMADKRRNASIGECWNAIDALADELDATRTRCAALEAENARLRSEGEECDHCGRGGPGMAHLREQLVAEQTARQMAFDKLCQALKTITRALEGNGVRANPDRAERLLISALAGTPRRRRDDGHAD